MPTYDFKNTKTGKRYTEFMMMSEREKYLEDNPDVVQLPSAMPIMYNHLGMKPDEGFRDILRNINHEHHEAKVNTFD